MFFIIFVAAFIVLAALDSIGAVHLTPATALISAIALSAVGWGIYWVRFGRAKRDAREAAEAARKVALATGKFCPVGALDPSYEGDILGNSISIHIRILSRESLYDDKRGRWHDAILHQVAFEKSEGHQYVRAIYITDKTTGRRGYLSWRNLYEIEDVAAHRTYRSDTDLPDFLRLIVGGVMPRDKSKIPAFERKRLEDIQASNIKQPTR
ncbi:hypothetical protein [Kozakia baliensis]|uniref:Uncharacterized protein n=1 Tax=Kozakia baliensis TaxID=153496 RepID=A0A1D8UTG9_9PROT|nr:hypothetical protein [Kozakia baliensis]AOX16941.1 hypothetical protein A0U89_07085 [Kozakia baliensis]GEL64011.1 hypothetical protein KBA01_12970 [Kozakia baliensis]